MTTYMVIGSVLLILVMILASKALIPKTKQQDSALRQRAIFSMHEQLTYTRLKEILPHHTVLAHVSYDALLTTKFSRTRNKYRNLVADFVIVDSAQQVLAVVALEDPLSLKRPQKAQFKDAILEMAGVKDVLTKSQGSSNPHNTVKAAMNALEQLEDAASVAARRGISVDKVLNG